MRPAGLALCLLLLAPAGAVGQDVPADVVVSHPPDLALVDSFDLPVEGYVRSGNLEEIDIVVNDGRPRRAVLRDRIFAEEVSLDVGLNTVRVGNVERQVWVATAREQAPARFERVYGHFGLNDGCLECHETDGEGAFTLAGEREEICTWCHGDLIRGRPGAPWVSVHAPVRAGRCLDCHAPHTSRKPGLPAAKPSQCGDCHAVVTDRLKTDRFVHGPMNLGDCRLCHVVHASAEPRLLAQPATALCTGCHSDALPPAGTPEDLRPHTMIPEGKCGGCHEPHSSENQRLLRQPAGRLCQGCHEGKTRSFHEVKGFSIYVCAKCHDLHRPTQPHLIVDASRSLCTQCHDFSGEAAFTHSFVAQGACFLCHTFHEASLPGDVATTCLRCHRENPRLPEAHRGVTFERSRCTVCHLPHQAQRANLLRAQEHTPFARRECDACHRDRAGSVGPVFRPLCLECHVALDLSQLAAPPAVLHPPFASEDCSRCHESHNAQTPGLLREPQLKLCLACHRAMRKATLLAPTSAHRAVLEGRCGECHAPHVSEQPSLLRTPLSEICVSCHAAVVRAPGGGPWPVPHKPVESGKCRLCHRHHTSGSPDLLKAPSPQPCRPCHAEFFASIEGAGGSIHKPVRDGSCAACHELHGGGSPKLLREGVRGAVCEGCHPKTAGTHHQFSAAQLEAGGSGSRARISGCLLCHLPHASRQRRLLLATGDAVCLSCHRR